MVVNCWRGDRVDRGEARVRGVEREEGMSRGDLGSAEEAIVCFLWLDRSW